MSKVKELAEMALQKILEESSVEEKLEYFNEIREKETNFVKGHTWFELDGDCSKCYFLDPSQWKMIDSVCTLFNRKLLLDEKTHTAIRCDECAKGSQIHLEYIN